ncbi:DUF317 domain-containing protein [Streptomyces sp. NPDC051956]|uniref:DUF317 domain-containing protein n=1 Tax=Streptomyces sp. NPDC051956 TaxID=3365677 RepID=UPI0037D15944
MELQSPDGMAGLEFTTGRLDPEKELTTLEARWYMWGGPKRSSGWYATASNTPTALLKAITESVSDPAPLPRWKDQMLRGLREHAQLAPVTPPPPPVPTPLEVRRTAPRRAPALTARASRAGALSRPRRRLCPPGDPARAADPPDPLRSRETTWFLARDGLVLFDNPDAFLISAFKRDTALCDPDPGATAPNQFACQLGCGNAVRTDSHAQAAREHADERIQFPRSAD